MKRILAILLTAALILSSLAGCGSTSASSATSDSSTAAATEAPAADDNAAADDTAADTATDSTEVRTVVAATLGGPNPFIYTTDDDELTGHNVELLKAVFEKLPQYELEFVIVDDLASILTGVNSGLYQIGCNNLAKNDEREELVHYTDPIMVNEYYIVLNKDLGITEFNGLEDLAGLTCPGSSGNDKTTLLEDWNEENPDKQINIEYTSEDLVATLQDVESGRYDFFITDGPMYSGYLSKEYDFDVLTFSLKGRASTKYSYFVTSYDDDELYNDINTALAEVIAEGTSTEICKEYLGADYTPGIADQN